MKIICIGRNYREHIREFDGGEPDERPVFFMKPDTALLRTNGQVSVSRSVSHIGITMR